MAATTIKKVSDYSGSATGGDWSLAITAIWNAIKDAGGGTVDWDEEAPVLKTMTAMQSKAVPIHFISNGTPRIQPDAGSGVTNLNIADMPIFTMTGMVFVGDEDTSPTRTTDTGALVYLGYTAIATIDKCIFAGIKVAGNMIEVGNGTRLWIRDSQLSGCSGTILKVNQGYSLHMKNVAFIDYLGIDTAFHDKSTDGAAWVVIQTPPAGVVGERTPVISMEDCRFDEASFKAVFSDGYPTLTFERCRVNISSSGSGMGFHIKNAKQVIFKHCHVGYNNVPNNPIIKLENVESCAVIGMTKDDNVNAPYKIHVDSASNAGLKLLGCDPDIIVEIV